jgi:hypothetical protein
MNAAASSIDKSSLPLTITISDISEDAPNSRAAQQILKEAYQQLGIQLEILILPIPRSVSLLDLEQLDGLVYRVSDAPLSDLMKINIPILFEEIHAFTVLYPIALESYKSLEPYTIGHLAGSRHYINRLKGMRVEPAPTEESLLRKLAVGRSQMAISTRSSWCTAKKLGLNNIKLLEPSLEILQGFHWLSTRHQHLYPKIAAILKKMKKNGRIGEINKQARDAFEEACRKTN